MLQSTHTTSALQASSKPEKKQHTYNFLTATIINKTQGYSHLFQGALLHNSTVLWTLCDTYSLPSCTYVQNLNDLS